MRSVFGIFACVLVLGLAACGDMDEEGITVVFDDELEGSISHNLTNGSADAVGLLNFLNDETTTFEVLDIDARLDKRSARGLVHHRNGPDGILGTWDDNRFDSVDEVDAVKWVGVKTIGRILNYATDLGFIPVAGDILGVYDRVSFTVLEADAVLELANGLGFDALDAFLNVRAVRSIVEGRPYASVEDLAAARYDGRSALSRLTAQASKPASIQQR